MDDESPVSTSWSPGNVGQCDRDDPSLARPSSSSSSAQVKDYGELPSHSRGPDSGHDLHMPSGSRLSTRNQHHHHNEDDDDDDDSDADHYTRQCSPHSQQQPPTSTTSGNSYQASRQDTFARAGSHETESYSQSYGEASPSSHHQQHHHRSYQSMQEDHVGSSQGSLPRLLTARSMRIENGEEDEDDDEDDHVSSRFVLNEVSNLTVEAMLADAPGERSVDDGFEGRSQPLALSLSHHHHHSVLETDPSDGETVANSISGNVVSEAGGSGLQSEDVLVISGRRTNAGWEQAVARVHDHDTGVHFGRMAVATQSATATTSKTSSSSSSLIVSSMQNYVTSSTGCLVEAGPSSLGQHPAGLVLDSVVDSTVSARSVVDHEVVGMEGSLVSIVRYTTTDDVSTTVDGSGHLSITSADVEGLNSAMDASSVSIGESSSIDVLRADFSLSDGVNATLSSTLENHQEQHMDITESIALNGPPHSTQRPRSLDQSVKGVWCEECNTLYDNGCLKHRIQTIFDKPVLSRAWASLPGSHLSIEKVGNNLDGIEVFGVFTKKLIPKRTQFGPVEGVLTKKMEGSLMPVVLQLECESGEIIFFDTSDESQSNWMRFVRPATNYCEQNVVVVQHNSSLFYTTVRAIPPKVELKVGYSQPYAERRGLAVLESEDGSKYDDDDGWPCFECSKRFCSSEELQKHLNEHGDGLTVCKVGDVEVHDYREAIDPNHVPEVDGDEANIAVINEIDGAPEAGPSRRRRSKVSTTPIKKLSKLKSIKKRALETVDEDGDGDGQSGHGEFPCNVCNKVFPRPYSLQRHLTMHSGEKKFKCPICEMRFSHVYNRNRHVRRHKARGDTCMSDSQGRPKSLFRKKHAVNEWICTHCDLTFDNANLLNLHTLTHAAEDVGGLDELGKHEPNCGGVAGLMKEESSDEAECLRCPQCTQEFSTKKELINHTSIHGKMRKSFRGLVNPIRPYKCELCYKAFATEERLHRHMLVHGSDDSKPLQCDVCYKRFLNNSALACHIKVHSEEKKYYECPICKEGFDQIIPLKDHIHVHCVDGLYTCPSCQKSFEEYNQIRKHIRAFHSEKKYPCGQCDKIFPRPDKLKLHMLRHSDHREFLCANCGKQFKRKDKLKEHMKRMHSAEREARSATRPRKGASSKKFIPKVSPTDYHRFIYKCHTCLLGFKRRGMLVNHLAKRHPGIRPESVPELNLPILKTTRDYYCQYCEKIYKSSSKRKAHILKQHPGAELPMSNRRKGGIPEIPGMPNPTFSQTVGSITTHPHNCDWCHKQYASKAKLLQHQRKKHQDLLPQSQQLPRITRDGTSQFVSTTTRVTSNAVILHHEVVSEVEYVTESVVMGGNIKPTLTKDGVVVTTTRPTTVFLERESSSPGVGESQVTVDAIPTADLLTQAMSELTQNLNDYRSQGTSPSATSAPPSDQSALSQLLGTYAATSSSSNSEATESEPIDSPMSAPAQAQSSTTTVFVPRTWSGTFEYATR